MMQTIGNPKKNSELYKKGQALIAAAYEYWQEFQKSNDRCPVVWLKDTSGHLVVFTRGEYKNVIMKNIDDLCDDDPMERPFEE